MIKNLFIFDRSQIGYTFGINFYCNSANIDTELHADVYHWGGDGFGGPANRVGSADCVMSRCFFPLSVFDAVQYVVEQLR